jgi:lysophospholipase L1-like esterase
MPDGALGIWYADQFSTVRRAVVPNAVTTTPTSYNLLAAPRGMFSVAGIYTMSGSATAVDNNATANDGTLRASTLTLPAGGSIAPSASFTLPGGTYTVVIEVRRSTGSVSDQPFKINFDGTATTKTATSAWQRLTVTKTIVGGASVAINIGGNGSTTATLEVGEFSVYSGSSDQGPEVYVGHMYPGAGAYDTNISVGSGYINFDAAQRFGIMQFATGTALTAYTVIAIASRQNSNTYSHMLSDAADYTKLTACFQESDKPQILFSGAPIAYPQTSFAAVVNNIYNETVGAGLHALTQRYDGTTFALFNDNSPICVDSTHTGRSTTTSGDLFAGIYHNPFWHNPSHRFAALAFYPRALSDAEVRMAVRAMKTRVALTQTVVTQNLVMFEGDSITDTSQTFSYARKFLPNASPLVAGHGGAITGSTIASLVTRASFTDSFLPPVSEFNGRKFILTVLIGANDINSMSNSTWLANFAAYCDARRAAGWKVVVCTVLARSDGAGTGFNAARNSINTTLRTWVGTHCDAIADFAADSTIGTDAAASNVTYFPDGLHPSDAGHVIMESIIRPVINGLQ